MTSAKFGRVSAPTASVVLATDGSVVPNIPKSGWGYVIRDSCGNLRVGHGGCKMLLSSMRAEIEAVSRGLNLMREVAPDTAGIIICTDSQALLRRLASGVSPPEWHGTSEKIIWVYCPVRVFAKCLLNFGLRPDRPAGIRHRQPMGDRQLRTVGV